jgi:glycosyltransferase involved in cell wall biosynthesis
MSHFTICVITKNEEKTLPRLLDSLRNFQLKGGEIVVVDTGSTDNTVNIARSRGCKVEEAGDRFIHTVPDDLVNKINNQFVVDNETPILKYGDKYFDFSSARNLAASLASNDWVSFADADETFTKLDTDKIDEIISDTKLANLEYEFVFSHRSDFSLDPQFIVPDIQFIQSKMYNKKKMQWVGLVHEVLSQYTDGGERRYLPPDIFLLDHWQLAGDKHSYLVGLAVDCYLHQEKDRNSHYFARELLWTGRPKSAIKEFERHISMKRWPAERSQSMIFISKAYGILNEPDKQVEWLNKAYYTDSGRREALIELALFYRHNNNPMATAVYASAALNIPWTGFYASAKANYEELPHELLYWAKGWLGDIPAAQKHILKALEYLPYNVNYLRDTKYYFEYPDNGIEGWMLFTELTWLYETAKKMDTIVEIGSWMGKSTHALLSGCKGKVYAVDTFEGSAAVNDWTHNKGIPLKVFDKFKQNVGHFKNLEIMKMTSKEASKLFKDKSVDMVFIDAGHTKEEVLEDIALWRNKAKIIVSGHDYVKTIWMGVIDAVDESMGVLDGVAGSIWHKCINKPFVSIIIPTLGRPEKLTRLVKMIKENAGYDNYEVIIKYDKFPPDNKGVPKLLKEGVEESRGDLVMYLGNDCIPEKDFLQLAVFRMIKAFPDLDGLVGLNDGYWKAGEMATHWLASKKLLPYLNGEFFHTGYYHTGCDNELTERCRKIGKYVWAKEAKIIHDHPVRTGFKDKDMDDVYRWAYKFERMEHDKTLLNERSKALGFELRVNFTDPDKIKNTRIEEFTKMVENGENFSFIKIGDGEINCMNGAEGTNCDNHPYTPELKAALLDAYKYLNDLEDTYIPKWEDLMPHPSPVVTKGNVKGDILLHTDTNQEKYDFYKTLKLSKRKKIFIGPKVLNEVKDFLNIDVMVEIPEVNAFSYKFNLEPENNAIYLFSSGMPSKVWIAKLLRKNRNITCIDLGSALDPIFRDKTRTRQLDKEYLRNYYKDLLDKRIPKRIFTIWLNDKKGLPPLIEKCIRTHRLEGYEYKIIILDNCFRNKYIEDAIKAKQWGKACDYLRCYYLIKEGGIYLDADVEMLPEKNFDDLLKYNIFAGRENNNFVNTAVLGAEKDCQLLKDHLEEVERRFKGDDGLYFESSIEIITPRLYKGATVLDPEYFYPYDHQRNTTTITDKTICIHHFYKSWKEGENK